MRTEDSLARRRMPGPWTHLFGNNLDFVLDGLVQVIQEAEAPLPGPFGGAGLLAGGHDGLGDVHRAGTTLGVVLSDDGSLGSGLEGGGFDDAQLRLRVGREAIDAHDDGHAKLARILDMLLHVADALGDEVQVLLAVFGGDGLAGCDLGAVAVHLERAHRRNEKHAVGLEPWQRGVRENKVPREVRACVHARPRARTTHRSSGT